eukprot:3940438-Rhodomonas_salina.3
MGAGGDGSEMDAEKQQPAPLVAADGAVWHGVDEKKVFDKFHHYDKDGNGKLDAQEVVDLSVDLYRAFHPGQELTPEQIKDVHDKLLERIDERHGDHDGTVSFEEFLPWSAQLCSLRGAAHCARCSISPSLLFASNHPRPLDQVFTSSREALENVARAAARAARLFRRGQPSPPPLFH